MAEHYDAGWGFTQEQELQQSLEVTRTKVREAYETISVIQGQVIRFGSDKDIELKVIKQDRDNLKERLVEQQDELDLLRHRAQALEDQVKLLKEQNDLLKADISEADEVEVLIENCLKRRRQASDVQPNIKKELP